MAALHIVNRSPALDACLEVAAESDAILLIEDGVYVAASVGRRPLLALRDDAAARGLTGRMGTGVELIGYADFVRLVEKHQPIVSWS